MQKLPVIIAAASTLWVFPVLAGQPGVGSRSSGSEHITRDLGSMRGSHAEQRAYGYEREGEMRRRDEDEWRYRHSEGMREGCKYITVRQRQGDEIVVRHFRRCD